LNDVFAFNESFTAPLAKLKIAQVASKVETSKETQEQVDEERRHQVEVSYLSGVGCRTDDQACIVRIMKDRKQMGHNDLISEVAHQLSSRFSPSMSMIKKRIEGLIDVSLR
jgi:cullin 3